MSALLDDLKELKLDADNVEFAKESLKDLRGLVKLLQADDIDRDAIEKYIEDHENLKGYALGKKDKDGSKLLKELVGDLSGKEIKKELNALAEKIDSAEEDLNKPKSASKSKKSASSGSKSAASSASKSASSTEEKSSKKTKKSKGKTVKDEEDEEEAESEEEKSSRKTKKATNKKGAVGRKPAGSNKSVKVVQGDVEADHENFYYSEMPGASIRKPENEEKYKEMEEGPESAFVAYKKAAYRNDLNKYYKFKNPKEYKTAFKANGQMIETIEKGLNAFSYAFGKYGTEAKFRAVQTAFKNKHIVSGKYTDYDFNDLKALQKFVSARLQVYIHWLAAKSSRDGDKPAATRFIQSNARYVLAKETIAWLKDEKFPVPDKIKKEGVLDNEGVAHKNLASYFEARTGKAWNKSHLLTDGLTTKGSLNRLIHLAIARNKTTQFDRSEKKKLRKMGKKTAPKYEWTTSMKEHLGGKTKATWDRELNDKNKYERVKNNTDKSVIGLVSDFTKEKIENSTDVKPRYGKDGKGKKPKTFKVKDSPFYATEDHLWNTNIAILQEYLFAKNPEITDPLLAKKYEELDEKQQAVLLDVLAEAQAITEFSTAIKDTISRKKKDEAKSKKRGPSSRKAV